MRITVQSAPAPLTFTRVCEIAQGGMGRVDLVLRHEGSFGRLYAVKRLHPHYRADTSFRAMFLDEARIAGLIRHPNVVSVLDVGDDAEGPFLLMDYVEGLPASQLITSANDSGELLPVQLCLRIVRQAAEGLHAAHELRAHDGSLLNLVHRDVSPQNLLIGYDGIVRVTDFGIAKAFGRSAHTSTGVLKGKVGYMSPEQLQFEEPDRRSDVFSLGIILYELLSGQRLYPHGEGMESARRILREPPPDIGDVRDDVPPLLVELLFELLAKDRENRPPDARTLARRIDPMLTDLAVTEGQLDVVDYLESRPEIEEARAAQQRELTKALEEIKRRKGDKAPAVVINTLPRAATVANATNASTNVATPMSESFVAQARSMKPSRAPMLWMGLAAAVLLLAGGVAIAVVGAGHAPRSEPRVASAPESPSPRPEPPRPEPPPADVTREAPIAVSVAPPPAAAPAQGRRATKSRATARPRGSQRTSRVERPQAAQGVHLWIPAADQWGAPRGTKQRR